MTNMAYAPLQAADKLCGQQTTAGYLQIPGRRSNHLIEYYYTVTPDLRPLWQQMV